ncbi:MAG: hypothetical protein QME64_11315 [bacterium]|nr:hypothetical protein [bacterium]
MPAIKEEIELEIDKTGRVIIHVNGVTGQQKTNRIQMVAQLVGRLDENYKHPDHEPKVFIANSEQLKLQVKK